MNRCFMSNKEMLRYRNVWLGCAMIWIVLYHSQFLFSIPLVSRLINIGYGGVDICLFASGAGCYYSLSGNPDIGAFIKRRFKRIAPTYLCFIVLWMVYQFLCNGISIPAVIGNLLAVQHLTGNSPSFNWYVSALVLLYILAPYLKAWIDRSSRVGQLLFGGFLLLLSVAFWDSRPMIIIAARLPVFYMGMLFARDSKHDTAISIRTAMLLLAATAAGLLLQFYVNASYEELLWDKGLYWYPFILIVPGLCVLICWVSRLCERSRITRAAKSCLVVIGEYSFELYLLHLPLIELVQDLIRKYGLEGDQRLVWLLSLVSLIVGCIVLKKAGAFAERRFFDRTT